MRLLRPLLARPALQLALAGSAVLFVALPGSGFVSGDWRLTTRLLLAWCLFVLIYFGLVWRVLGKSLPSEIRKRAARYDAGAGTILVLAVLAAGAGFASVVAEVLAGRSDGLFNGLEMSLAAVSVVLSWSFVHVMFALHYAHAFYLEGARRAPPLRFPGTDEPRYGDFLYFSFVIGCACATADVDVLDPQLRRLAAVHGAIAFFFNAAIVGLSVNIAAGLIGR